MRKNHWRNGGNDECWRAQWRMRRKKIASLIFINKSHHGSSHNWTFIGTTTTTTATGQKEKTGIKINVLYSNIFLNVTDFWWHYHFRCATEWQQQFTHTKSSNTHTHTEKYWPTVSKIRKLLFYWNAPPVALGFRR